MSLSTFVQRAAFAFALALLLSPWASAQKLTAPADPRVESSASLLGLPDASADVVVFESPATSSLADILNETFDALFTGGPPAAPPGWIQLRTGTGAGATATGPDWVRFTSSPCSVANPCASSAFYSTAASQRYLVSPQVTPSAAAGNILSFRLGQVFSGAFGSVLRVAVSTGGATATEFDANVLRTITETEIAVGGFTTFTVDLSAYNDTPIYVALVHVQNDGDTFRLDDVRIAEPTPASFTSTTTQFQNTAAVGAGEETWVIAANVVVGGTVGTVEATEMTFSTTGSTSAADIASARLLYSGASTTFSYTTTPVFGSPVANPNGTITFTGSQALPPGNNYFILVYGVSTSATASNVLDATYDAAVIGGTSRTPTATTLTGTVPIVVRPLNNNLLSALPVTATGVAFSGTSVGSNSEAGELNPTCGSSTTPSSTSTWYAYTPSADGTASFDLLGSSFDTVLSLHTGTGHPLTQVACNDDRAGGGATSLISGFSVTAGTTYWIRISGWLAATGATSLTVTGPAPEDGDFAFSRPSSGQLFRLGGRLKPIWSHSSSATDVRVSLCRTGAACVVTYTGPNLAQPDFGDAVYTIPTGTTPASTYYLVVQDTADPSSFGSSASFTIYDPSNVFSVTAPSEAASGTTTTVEWTSPPSNPPTDVTISLSSRDGSTVHSSITTANDGSEAFAIPALPNGSYSLSVCPSSGADPSCGSSVVRVRPTAVFRPSVGEFWATGSTQTVEWASAACDSGTATADIFLRPSTGGKILIGDDEDCDGTADVTVPTDVADGQYFVQVQIFEGSSRVSTGNSATFSVGSASAAPVAGTSRVASPMVAGAADAIVRVATPGLADGTEVAVSADRLILGTGIVRAGEAEVVLFGTVADPMLIASGLTAEEAMEIVAPGTELTVSTWSADGEAPLELGRITDADGREVAALTFEIGAEYVVAAKGATTGTADAFSLERVSPNPTSGAASVRFTVAESQDVRVTVYDLLGREVATLFEGTATAGANEVRVPALTAGVYVVRVATPTTSATTRFTVVR